MAAVVYPQPRRNDRHPAPPLRLVAPPPRLRRRRRPSRAAYRRRRLVALLLIVGVVLLARAAFGWLGGGPLTASEPTSLSRQPPGATYVVQPGDTLWTLARRVQPEGDIRSLVNRLAVQRGGSPLAPGERITLPAD